MSQRLEEPKTMGECWETYKRFGFMKPEKPLDESIFPNAQLLVRMHNAHLDEIERLTKERYDHGPEGRNYTNGQYVELLMKYEAVQAANTAMREALEWYKDDSSYKLGTNCGLGERARSVLEKIGEGESNE